MNRPRRDRPGPRLACLLILASAGLCMGPAAADRTVDNRTHRFRVTLDSAWQEMSVPAPTSTPLAGYEHQTSGALLAISRIDYPNLAAWRQRTRDEYYRAIEAGIAASTPGYAALDERQALRGKVPSLDLVYRRRVSGKREVVVLRLLFFRRYALALAMIAPWRMYRRHKKILRAVQQSFVPYFVD